MRKSKNRLLLLIAGIFILISASWTASAEYSETEAAEMYNNAGNLYQSNFYADALNIYEELVNDGIENPDLFYNSSNAAFRAGSIGKAILYVEKALKLNPSDPDALSNLRFLNSRKQDREPPQDNIVIAFLARHYNYINMNSAALWSGISFAMAMLFAAGALYAYGWVRQFFAAASVALGLMFVLSTGILIQKAGRAGRVVEAVIMGSEVNAYSGPGEDNTHIFIIHEGTKVVIERSQNSWNLIRLRSGAGGWIKADAMEDI